MAKPKFKLIRIVIADDHELLRMGLAHVLDNTPGITVVGQADRQGEAKKLVFQLKPDVVLLDISLPDGSGVDAARDILANCPTTRVLFLTSFGDDHTVLEALLSGVHGFLMKDITSDELIRAIRTVASGQSLIDPRVTRQSLEWLQGTKIKPGKSGRPFFSPQEQRLLPLVAQGLTNKEIAESLQLHIATVRNYINNICMKLNIGRRSQIASFYARSFKGAGGPKVAPGRPSYRPAYPKDLS